MSRSKRIPRDVPPKQRRRFLRNENGAVRPGWALAAMVLGWLALTVGLRLGLGALLSALFRAWNLTPSTVARAPGWAAALYSWQGSLVTLAVDAAALVYLARVCRARLTRPEPGRFGLWWLVGTGIAVLSAALFLMADSLRAEWPLISPHLSLGLLPLWALTLLTALAEELFTKGVLYDRLKGPWGIAASTLAFFLLNGGYAGTWLSAVNVALMGALCTLHYRRFGLWAPVGFRWGWGFSSVFLLGQGGGDHAVYRLYGVSENLLTGGDAGLVYGAWMTGVLIALSMVLIIQDRKNKP